MNNVSTKGEGAYRTAFATPGLLIIGRSVSTLYLEQPWLHRVYYAPRPAEQSDAGRGAFLFFG